MAVVRPLPNPVANASDTEMGWTPVYERFVAQLAAMDAGSAAPRPGEAFPELSLPDTRGRFRSIREIAGGKPLVVSFNRGTWCYYCTHELQAWSAVLPSLREAGAELVVITGELGGGAEQLAGVAGADVPVLCDVDHGGALACGLAIYVGDEIRQRYIDYGLDLMALYGSDAGLLPIPATFVLDRAGIVRFAHVDPDFRLRPDPADLVSVVRDLLLPPTD